uniref:5-hydroxytryptamine receptor 1 (inferred by orthology to a D. melanogaster protein) n=1 Tax=Strongyloides venezuelensis TaxID=75913 RepID=A0A0K0EXV3_STRVS
MSVTLETYTDYDFLPNNEDVIIENDFLLNVSHNIPIKPFIVAIICIVVSIIIVVTLIGNLMLCLAVFMVRKLKQPPNFLLVNLAVADFSVGFFVMPIAFLSLFENKWILGETVCRLWTSADLTLCTASILNLCFITVDRYLIITKPLRYCAQRTSKRIFIYILLVWCGALLVSVTPLIFLPWKMDSNVCQVPQNQFYQIYATFFSFYGPTAVMVILYWKMLMAAKRLTEKEERSVSVYLDDSDKKNLPLKKLTKTSSYVITSDNDLSSSESGSKFFYNRRSSAFLNVVRMPLISHTRRHSQQSHHAVRENKARITLGVIMSTFIVCWLPFFIMALMKSFKFIDAPRWLDNLTLWLGYSNSMLNPLIYCKYNAEFRVPFREMLCCRFRTLKSVVRHESFTKKYGPLKPQKIKENEVEEKQVAPLTNKLSVPEIPDSSPTTSKKNSTNETQKNVPV